MNIANINFSSETKVKANIILISFKEEDNFIVYSPHLEVSGYGKTEQEAMESFNYSLAAFFDYAPDRKSLHSELKRLGWHLKKGSEKHPGKIDAPSMKELIANNEQLEELLDKHDITTTQREIEIPVKYMNTYKA